MNLSGPILFILIVAVLLAVTVAWAVAWRYQRRMLSLMRSGPPVNAIDVKAQFVSPSSGAPRDWGEAVDFLANRRAHSRPHCDRLMFCRRQIGRPA